MFSIGRNVLRTVCASRVICVSLIWNLTNSLLSLLSLAVAEWDPFFFSKVDSRLNERKGKGSRIA